MADLSDLNVPPASILRRPVEKGEKHASRRGYTRIRFGARFIRYTVANNRSGNSAGIVSAGVVHSTPQTVIRTGRSRSSSSLSLLSSPSGRRRLHPLDTRQMTISPSETERARFIFLLAVALFSSPFNHYLPAEFAFSSRSITRLPIDRLYPTCDTKAFCRCSWIICCSAKV